MGELVFLSGYFNDGLLIFLFLDHYSTTVFIFITGIEHALSTFHIWKKKGFRIQNSRVPVSISEKSRVPNPATICRIGGSTLQNYIIF